MYSTRKIIVGSAAAFGLLGLGTIAAQAADLILPGINTGNMKQFTPTVKAPVAKPVVKKAKTKVKIKLAQSGVLYCIPRGGAKHDNMTGKAVLDVVSFAAWVKNGGVNDGKLSSRDWFECFKALPNNAELKSAYSGKSPKTSFSVNMNGAYVSHTHTDTSSTSTFSSKILDDISKYWSKDYGTCTCGSKYVDITKTIVDHKTEQDTKTTKTTTVTTGFTEDAVTIKRNDVGLIGKKVKAKVVGICADVKAIIFAGVKKGESLKEIYANIPADYQGCIRPVSHDYTFVAEGGTKNQNGGSSNNGNIVTTVTITTKDLGTTTNSYTHRKILTPCTNVCG